jgi:hypothetical protein
MRADDLSKPPCSLSPARFDTSTGWTTRIKIVERQCPPKDGARPHTSFNVRARFCLQQAKILKICGHLDVPFLVTCYTDVESNGRTPHTKNPNCCQMCDLRARDACTRRMTVSPSPAPKVSPARFDIHPYRLDNRIKDRRTSYKAAEGQVRHTGFNVCARFGLQQAQPPQNFHLFLDVPI